MSRLSNRSVRLLVASHDVEGTLSRGWLRRTVLARSAQPLEPRDPADPSAGDSPLPATTSGAAVSIDSVLRELERAAPLRGAALHVELAEGWSHLDVTAGDFAAHGIRQLHAIATACLAELLGESSAEHETRWFLQDDARHLLISAAHRDTLGLVADAATRFGLRLASVQPHFSLQWNRHARALKPGSAVFVVASSRYTVIAFAVRGVISAISSGAWRGHGAELDARVDRLLSSLGWRAETLAAFVLVTRDAQAISPSARWRVVEHASVGR